MQRVYFRPAWNCGRYNEKHHAALMFNLMEGMSYYFEDESADVIGEILKKEKNDRFSINDISAATNICKDSLEPFLYELIRCGLLTDFHTSDESVSSYRKYLMENKSCQDRKKMNETQEYLPYPVSSAEMDYADRVGGVVSVMFELTYNCSEKCIHCYNPGATRNDKEISHRGDRKELTLDDYKRIIDELYELGLAKVCLSGGDPFSNPFVWEIIDYLYMKGIATALFTNAQRLFGKEERLAAYYPLLVGISIYSGIAAEHDYITRIKGSWERSMAVVKKLSQLAVPMNLKCCIMRTNVKHYYMVADIAEKFGAVPQFEVSLTDSIDGDICVSRNLRLTPEQLEIVLRDRHISLYVGKELPNYGGQKKYLDNIACGAGITSFCITPEGFVQPCCAFPSSFGNLRDQSFGSILESSELEWWHNLRLRNYEECGRHDYCDYCNLCSGTNFSEHGTPLKASENNCYMAKIRFALAARMMKDNYDPLQGKTLVECLEDVPTEYSETELRRIETINHKDKKMK